MGDFAKSVVAGIVAALVSAVLIVIAGAIGWIDALEDRFQDPSPCPVFNAGVGQAVFNATGQAVEVLEGADEGESGREISFSVCRETIGDGQPVFLYYGTNSDGEFTTAAATYDPSRNLYLAQDANGGTFSMDCPEGVWLINGEPYDFDEEECA